jgi:hypothetical protein
MDGVEADDFARQVKSQYLLLPLVVDHVTLETTRAHGGHRAEFIAGPEQVFAGLNRAGAMDYLLETLCFVWGESARQAKFAERTAAAGYLGA